MKVNRRAFLKMGGGAVSLLFFRPGYVLSYEKDIPVLLYHDISDSYADEYTISPSLFAAHLEWLSSNGYRALSLRELTKGGRGKDEKAVIITFDDGYASFIDFAFPLLEKHRFKSTVNIIGAFVGSSIDLGGMRPMLGWDEYRFLKKSGLVDLGCHTHSLHTWKLWNSNASEAALMHDLTLFRKIFRRGMGEDTEILAWPYGIYNRRRIKIAIEAGFRYLLTSNEGYLKVESNLLEIPRQTMNSTSGMVSFREFIRGPEKS